jgi:hypothetical protein
LSTYLSLTFFGFFVTLFALLTFVLSRPFYSAVICMPLSTR